MNKRKKENTTRGIATKKKNFISLLEAQETLRILFVGDGP